jgi:arylsulfatase A-like enzyme
MRFMDAHTPAGLCAPTRYSMLTGNYPWRGRAPGGTWGFNVPSQLKPGQETVATMLQRAGYRTAMFGKAGTGGFWADSPGTRPAGELAPIEWGFDYSFLIPRGHQATPHAFYENGVAVGKVENGRVADWDPGRVGERLLEKAGAFLDDVVTRSAAAGLPQPFYLHFCTDGAHSPYVPAESLAGAPLKGTTKMTEHTDMVHETDILTGALVAALDKRGLLTNTLIFVTSDNGGLPHERQFGHDAVAGLRGKKSFIFEGGHRVPFIACWPGHIPAGTVRQQVVGTHDTVATTLELAGAAVPPGQALDSVSLVPVLLGRRDDSQPVRDDLLVQSSPGRDAFDDGGSRAGRTGSLAKDQEAEAEATPKTVGAAKRKRQDKGRGMAHAVYRDNWKLVFDGAGQPAALYDLTKDLAEERNLIADVTQAARVGEMSKRFETIRQSTRSVPAVSSTTTVTP